MKGQGAKAPEPADKALRCAHRTPRCPGRERRPLPGRVMTRIRSVARLATGTTHGADPRAPLPHRRGTRTTATRTARAGPNGNLHFRRETHDQPQPGQISRPQKRDVAIARGDFDAALNGPSSSTADHDRKALLRPPAAPPAPQAEKKASGQVRRATSSGRHSAQKGIDRQRLPRPQAARGPPGP
jgi:hypothetical protein